MHYRVAIAAVVLTFFAGMPVQAEEKIDLKLISRSHAESDILWRNGFVLEDSLLQPELQNVLDQLTAGKAVDPAIKLRVCLFNSPELNAFAMPDGSVYLFVGLLARLNSMDELAFVIGHEATHAIAWHGQKYIEQAKSKNTIFQMLSLTTSLAVGSSGWSGAGLINSLSQLGLTLAAAASITGYSRDEESEADMSGYDMVRASGRNGCACVDALRALLSEIQDQSALNTFFWGSHPRTVDRIHALEERAGTACVSDAALDSGYTHIKYPMLKLRARMWNRAGMPQRALVSVAPYIKACPNDPDGHCIAGDALAVSTNADTLALAAQSYHRALDLGGAEYRDPLLGLATVAEASRDTVAAVTYLEHYLDGNANVPRRRSTRRHMEDLKKAYHWTTRAGADSLRVDDANRKED
ncbi:MAG TPA: M48 family metallopeptidase [Candidatus Krumholzibacteria bacterium]|nr:M48 family metallopeptidase [Candidatus Krumholzibacteria bacterium]